MGLGRLFLGYSRDLEIIFILQNNFGNLILENGDERLGKTFCAKFQKNKIGFNKIIFAVKTCDAMMLMS